MAIIKNVEYVKQITPSAENPRNSEGDFLHADIGGRKAILFVYTRFSGGSADDASADLACLLSYDGGRTFSLPEGGDTGVIIRASEYGVNNIMSVSLLRFENGDAGIFFLVKEKDASTTGRFRRFSSDDDILSGRGEDIKVFPVVYPGYYVVNNCRIEKVGGRLFIPAALHRSAPLGDGMTNDGRGVDYVFYSEDDGRTWKEEPGYMVLADPYSGSGLQEPGIAGLPDGSLYCYARTDLGAQYESFSTDGRYWTIPQRSRFTAPCSPLKIARSPYSGKYYAVWNPYGGSGAPQLIDIDEKNRDRDPHTSWQRTPIVIAESADCRSWSAPEILDDDPKRGYCYPAVFFADKDTLLVSYCSGGPEDGHVLCRTTIARIGLG
ncbi:MAG: glycoside hydrolase [Clostridiales bacterium]|nr:glycoside hydrolase [Clostridiales bacterium]